MDSGGGREKEREVQIEKKGRAEVREFNEIWGFCSDTRQVKNNGSAPTTDIMILHLIYCGVKKSETTSEKLLYLIFLGYVHAFLNVLIFGPSL